MAIVQLTEKEFIDNLYILIDGFSNEELFYGVFIGMIYIDSETKELHANRGIFTDGMESLEEIFAEIENKNFDTLGWMPWDKERLHFSKEGEQQ